MDPLVLGSLVALVTVLVLFSGVPVAVGLLIVSAGFARPVLSASEKRDGQ